MLALGFLPRRHRHLQHERAFISDAMKLVWMAGNSPANAIPCFFPLKLSVFGTDGLNLFLNVTFVQLETKKVCVFAQKSNDAIASNNLHKLAKEKRRLIILSRYYEY